MLRARRDQRIGIKIFQSRDSPSKRKLPCVTFYLCHILNNFSRRVNWLWIIDFIPWSNLMKPWITFAELCSKLFTTLIRLVLNRTRKSNYNIQPICLLSTHPHRGRELKDERTCAVRNKIFAFSFSCFMYVKISFWAPFNVNLLCNLFCNFILFRQIELYGIIRDINNNNSAFFN